MPDSFPSIPAGLQRDFATASIRSTIVDVPTVRRHALSSLSVTAQSYVIVELRLANGADGIGEAATLGGHARASDDGTVKISDTAPTCLDNRLTADLSKSSGLSRRDRRSGGD